MARIAPYSATDFNDIKQDLYTFLKNQDRFKGYDFEGSNLSVLVDLMAYNAYNNMTYYNMSIGEMFLDSAQLRNSAVSHAKELNYLPRSRRSSSATVDVTITSIQDSNTFIVPKNAIFLGRCGNITYEFLTTDAYAASRVSGTNTFKITGVKIYEGRLINEVLPFEQYTLSNSFVDTSSIRVFVNGTEFKYTDTIFGVNPTDNVFYIQPEINEKYSIQFGENNFGYQPTASDDVTVQYRVCTGSEANGVASFTIDSRSLSARNIVVNPQGVSLGGTDVETLESIKKFAPKAFQTQERAVTASDYETLLRRRFPEIESISVYGGDEAVPPQFGRVIISVDVQGRDGASDTELELYKNYIKKKSPIAIEPVFIPAEFMYADLEIEIKYDRNDSLYSVAQIEALVREIATTFSDDTLDDFDVGLVTSALQAQLLTATDSVVSASVTAHPIIEWAPNLNVTVSPAFNFGTELVKPYPYNSKVGLVDFKPAFSSTVLTLQGQDVILQDDGLGNIQALVANANERSIFKNSIGTIDYNRGIISLKDTQVENFEGNAIKLIVNSVDKDIFPPKERIIRIRQQDVTVNVRPTR